MQSELLFLLRIYCKVAEKKFFFISNFRIVLYVLQNGETNLVSCQVLSVDRSAYIFFQLANLENYEKEINHRFRTLLC